MDASSTSFWERRPWLGAILFALLVSGVGLFLAIKVGQRPHLRSTWSLVSEIHRGHYDAATPWRNDPIRVLVRIRTHDEANAPIVGAQVALIAEGFKVVSRGFTAPPEGHIHLPVPERFARAVFNGEIRAAAIIPGGSTVWGEIPPPKEGMTSLQIGLESTRTIQVSLVDAEGRLVTKVARVNPLGADGIKPAFSTPWTLERGTARIAGVRRDAALLLETQVAGHAPVRTHLSAARESIQIPLGAPCAQLSVPLRNGQNKPLRNHPIRLRVEDEAGVRPIRMIHTDPDGHLRTDLQPGNQMRLILTGRETTKGAILETPRLQPNEVWKPAAVRIAEFPVLLRGKVLKPDGTPCADAMVTVRPWGQTGRVETTRTSRDLGEFVVRCAPFSNPVFVTAFCEGLAGGIHEQIAPTAHAALTIRLAVTGRISGVVDAVAAVIEEGVTVIAVLPGIRNSAAALHATHVERDGRFELFGVATGVYDILVVRGDEAAHVIEKVLVAPEGGATDPRLTTVRIR